MCRWGGEEFCFFLPEKNLDDAGREMEALRATVSHMPLSFDGHDFSIRITIGVEENDFDSPVEGILNRATRSCISARTAGGTGWCCEGNLGQWGGSFVPLSHYFPNSSACVPTRFKMRTRTLFRFS